MSKYNLFILIAISSLLLTTSIQAALPPIYQSTREFRRLLDDPKLTEIMGSAEPIESITRSDNAFVVRTQQHVLKVDVVYESMDHPGPAKFHFIFHSLESAQK